MSPESRRSFSSGRKRGRAPSRPSAELTELAGAIGLLAESWGLGRAHGLLWIHLFLSREPLGTGELARRVGISRDRGSRALADLLRYDAIRKAGDETRGRPVYRANPDVAEIILNVIRARERRMLARVASASRLWNSLPPESPERTGVDGERLAALAHLAGEGMLAIESFLRTLQLDLSGLRPFRLVGRPGS